jgi:hypothetical protein
MKTGQLDLCVSQYVTGFFMPERVQNTTFLCHIFLTRYTALFYHLEALCNIDHQRRTLRMSGLVTLGASPLAHYMQPTKCLTHEWVYKHKYQLFFYINVWRYLVETHNALAEMWFYILSCLLYVRFAPLPINYAYIPQALQMNQYKYSHCKIVMFRVVDSPWAQMRKTINGRVYYRYYTRLDMRVGTVQT